MKFIEARASGSPRYYGKLCVAHPSALGERYTSTSRCVICARSIARAQSRKEVTRASARARRQTPEFKEKMREWKRRYRTSEKGIAKTAEYKQREYVKEQARAYARSEKARERLAAYSRTERRRSYMRRYMKRPELAAAKRIYKAQRENYVSKYATPKWNDKNKMAAIYAESKRLSALTGQKHVVDHIVPLSHELVCGLHAHTNLRVVLELDNLKKNNRLIQELAVSCA